MHRTLNGQWRARRLHLKLGCNSFCHGFSKQIDQICELIIRCRVSPRIAHAVLFVHSANRAQSHLTG
ncbi:hypothetical protein XAPC_1603 [Xanthomonas citri pv. punicae str. LMG 859]|nr:hypothetical protein XAPC_1603 [Xanthomonas citri pv. punicae str. LMG 859]